MSLKISFLLFEILVNCKMYWTGLKIETEADIQKCIISLHSKGPSSVVIESSTNNENSNLYGSRTLEGE